MGWQDSLVQRELGFLIQAPKTFFFFFFRTLGTSVASGLGGTALQNQVAQEKGEGGLVGRETSLSGAESMKRLLGLAALPPFTTEVWATDARQLSVIS